MRCTASRLPKFDWLRRTLTPLSCVPCADPSASKRPRRKPRWKSLDGTGVALYGPARRGRVVARVRLGGADDPRAQADRVAKRVAAVGRVVSADVQDDYLRLELSSDRDTAEVASAIEGQDHGVLVFSLGEALEIVKQVGPAQMLRERNGLLLAAGYAPAYPERDLDDEAMAPVRAALEHLLRAHEPYPALVVDRHWELLAANRPVGLLTAGASPELLEPAVNVLRLSLHPEGVARRIINLAEWREHILARLHRQALATGDAALFALHDELSDYPSPGPSLHDHDAGTIAVPLRISTEVGELSFLSTATSFGAAAELTLSELAIEAFYPADADTAERLSAAPPR